ncbi:S-adenosyl-l-methionine hydroxide adenosyltransferase family protein, partial [Candidatus Bathyarchaeota archaeon]|nr:S-adenosyl-l-methionine hydroxide adenosyltransferase family protein [Candidatus Bathyarchaeota archaeon]
MRKVITLLTDFGLSDPYPALMKGVILNINPEATIVDLSHSIDKFNVKMGAFILAYTVDYFPENSIHVAVVDPGVGTARKPLIVKCSKGYLIGPDNGLLIPAAEKLGLREVYEIDVDKVSIGRTSQTFHGRDVFAPAAARISNGEEPDLLGKPYNDYVKLTLPEPKILDECILGEVLYVNGFGNVVTNVDESMVKALNIKTGDSLLIETTHGSFKVKFVNAYGAVKPGSPLAIINSFRRLELAVNLSDGSKFFQLK